MKAVIAREPGDPDVLEMVEVDDPTPGPDELLVRVRATALNRADVLQRRGLYPPPEGASDVLGLEVAGVVADMGHRVTGWTIGDRVCAVVAAGGYAEFALVPAHQALPVPAALELTAAAAVPEVFTTAWDNVFTRGRLVADERLLVHGGSSGVGTAAIQLARRAGAHVAVTASTAAKRRACEQLGAALTVDYTTEDFAQRVVEWTAGRGVDVILDIVGGAYLERNLASLALEGRLMVIGLQQGTSADLDLATVMARRLTIGGSTLRARSRQEKAAVAQTVRARVLPGFDDGSLTPVVHRAFDWTEVADAHRLMEQGSHIGKIVLRVT